MPTVVVILAACGQGTFPGIPGLNSTSDTPPHGCDNLIKKILIFQGNAKTSAIMQFYIEHIQDNYTYDCNQELWNPTVDDTTAVDQCWKGNPPTRNSTENNTVGKLKIPATLYDGQAGNALVRLHSGKDDDRNIIIYWSHDDSKKPADKAACWLYSQRFSEWGSHR